MKYEFNGKIDGINNDKYYKRIRLLNVGIIACAVFFLLSLFVGEKTDFILIVPLVSFFSYKRILEGKLSFITANIVVCNNGEAVSVTAANCVVVEEEICSYLVETGRKYIRARYYKREEVLELTGKMTECYINGSGTVVTSKQKLKKLNLYTDEINASEIIITVMAKP